VFCRSQDSLALLFGEQSGDQVSGRSEALFGRVRSGFGFEEASFGHHQLQAECLGELPRMRLPHCHSYRQCL
jgi:hypothetical protein